jgi:hypothetical protein
MNGWYRQGLHSATLPLTPRLSKRQRHTPPPRCLVVQINLCMGLLWWILAIESRGSLRMPNTHFLLISVYFSFLPQGPNLVLGPKALT